MTPSYEKITNDFEILFVEYPDMLSVQHAEALAEATTKTVNAWIRKKYLKAFNKAGAYRIPKLALIEYLTSPLYRGSPSGKRKYAGKCCTTYLEE